MIELDLSKVRVGGKPLKQPKNQIELDLSKVRLSTQKVNFSEKDIISSADLNKDKHVDILDAIKAKQMTNASPTDAVRQVNTENSKHIKNYLISPKYSYDSAIRTGIEMSKKDKLTAKESSKIVNILKTAIEDKTLSEDEKKYYNSYLGQFSNIVKSKKEINYWNERNDSANEADDRNILEKTFDFLGRDIPFSDQYKSEIEQATKNYENSTKGLYYSSLPNGEYKKPDDALKKGWLNLFQENFPEYKYIYINSVHSGKNTLPGVNITMSGEMKLNTSEPTIEIFEQMDDREIGIYNYLYSNEGTEAADKFLNYITDSLVARQRGENLEWWSGFADEYPVTAALGSILLTPVVAAEQVKVACNYLINGELERNYVADVAGIMRSSLPEKVDLEIADFDVFDFVYNTTMSAADTIITLPLGAGAPILLGLNASANTMNDIIDRGGTDSQAFWGGVAAGTFEGFFEKFSIGELNAMKDSVGSGFKVYAGNLTKSILVNGSEETATEIANILYDYAVNGGISQYAMLIEDYTQKNPKATEKEAREYAAKQLGFQILEAGASGALMGFGFGAAGSVFSHKNAKSIGKVVAANGMENQVLDLALKTDINSNAHKLADRILKSGKMRPAQIGSVVAETMQELTNRKQNIVSDAIYKRAVALGLSESKAQNFTKQFVKLLSGEKLSDTVKKRLKSEPIVKQILAEIQAPEGNAWVAEMNEKLNEIDSITTKIKDATKISKKPTLQSGAEVGAEGVQFEGVPELTEAEQQILNTPDNELTPEQRAVKQNILERQQKNIAQSGDAAIENVIDISTNNELSKLLGNLQRTEKYKKIKEYILGILGGRKIDLSDGKTAIVDGRDAQHMASNAGSKKIAQISQITEIIKKSKLVAEEDSTKEKKFDYFYYYEILVKDGKETYPVYLNVGRARNDGTYHIYDITQKLRDTAHRVNDVWRPVGNAMENGISNNMVAQKPPIVNNNISETEENNSENSNLQLGAKGTIFTEPTEIEKSEAQSHIENVARMLDKNLKVVFLDKDSAQLKGKRGKFLRSTNTLFISKDATVIEAYVEVFKHEFVHRLETRRWYQSFKNYLFNKSSAFEQYARTQLKLIHEGEEFKGTREEAIKALTEYYYKEYTTDENISQYIKDSFTMEDAEREVVADFAADVLFKGEKYRKDIAFALAEEEVLPTGDIDSSIDALEELANTDRNLFKKVWDAIKDLINAIMGRPQTQSLTADLEYIENRLKQVYDSADTKKPLNQQQGSSIRYLKMYIFINI